MEILYRNFTKLLSIGVFGENCPVEDMSEFKWNKLLRIAGICDVEDFVCDGIVKSDNKLIPSNIYITAQNNISVIQDAQTTANYNFTSGKPIKKFSNFYLNRKLNKIIFDEIHSIDTSINSLILLNKLIDNINSLLNNGIEIRKLADLGGYLRKYGDRIDFVKIETWIRLLKIKKICTLIGCMLVSLFSFEIEELPFMRATNNKIQRKTDEMLNIFLTSIPQPAARHENNENHGQGINPITKPNTNPLKFFNYFPVETASKFISNIARSLSNIDE